jgi:3-oxoadipate enol-lactonase
MSTQIVVSGDGTRLRAWCNDGAGPAVLLCNGLGTPPEAWPRITARESGYRVVTWDQRGLGGSERPVDPGRVRVEDHTEDPARVRAVLAVAGIPGGSYSSLFGTYGVPRRIRPRMGRLGSRLLPVVGPLLPLLVASLPPARDLWSPAAVRGPAQEAAHPGALWAVLHEFARHDWNWYRHLSLALAEHAPLDVAAVRCPVTFVAGRYDSLVDVRDVRQAARAVPGARLREVPATHFVPLQFPDVMVEELARLLAADR